MTEWTSEPSAAHAEESSDISSFELELVDEEVVALELPVWEPTGEGRVDAALDRLHDVVNLPTAEHVEVYEDVYRRLGEALADLESTN